MVRFEQNSQNIIKKWQSGPLKQSFMNSINKKKPRLMIDGDDRIFLDCQYLKVNAYPDISDTLQKLFFTCILFNDNKEYDFEWHSFYDKNEYANYHFFVNIAH